MIFWNIFEYKMNWIHFILDFWFSFLVSLEKPTLKNLKEHRLTTVCVYCCFFVSHRPWVTDGWRCDVISGHYKLDARGGAGGRGQTAWVQTTSLANHWDFYFPGSRGCSVFHGKLGFNVQHASAQRFDFKLLVFFWCDAQIGRIFKRKSWLQQKKWWVLQQHG